MLRESGCSGGICGVAIGRKCYLSAGAIKHLDLIGVETAVGVLRLSRRCCVWGNSCTCRLRGVPDLLYQLTC